jgi:hypothetical protein
MVPDRVTLHWLSLLGCLTTGFFLGSFFERFCVVPRRPEPPTPQPTTMVMATLPPALPPPLPQSTRADLKAPAVPTRRRNPPPRRLSRFAVSCQGGSYWETRDPSPPVSEPVPVYTFTFVTPPAYRVVPVQVSTPP